MSDEITTLRGEVYEATRVNAQMRAALVEALKLTPERKVWEASRGSSVVGGRAEATLAVLNIIDHALSTSAGRGWVSPEEHQQALATLDENHRRREREWYERKTAEHAGLCAQVEAMTEAFAKSAPPVVIMTGISPEAFDAALREVATHAFASGRRYEMSDAFDAMLSGADFDHESIIAAAKAKHGGGK